MVKARWQSSVGLSSSLAVLLLIGQVQAQALDALLHETGIALTFDRIYDKEGIEEREHLKQNLPVNNLNTERVRSNPSCESKPTGVVTCMFGGENTIDDELQRYSNIPKPFNETAGVQVDKRYQMNENVNIVVGLPWGITSGYLRSPVTRNHLDHMIAYSATGMWARFSRSGDATICTVLPYSRVDEGLYSREEFQASTWNLTMVPYCGYMLVHPVDSWDWDVRDVQGQKELRKLAFDLLVNFLHGPSTRTGTYISSNVASSEVASDGGNGDKFWELEAYRVTNASEIVAKGSEHTWETLTWSPLLPDDFEYRETLDACLNAHTMVSNAVGGSKLDEILSASMSSSDAVFSVIEELGTVTLVLVTMSSLFGFSIRYILEEVKTESFLDSLFKAFIIFAEIVASIFPSLLLLFKYGIRTQTTIEFVQTSSVAVHSSDYVDSEYSLEIALGYGSDVQFQLLTIGLPTWFIVVNILILCLWTVITLINAFQQLRRFVRFVRQRRARKPDLEVQAVDPKEELEEGGEGDMDKTFYTATASFEMHRQSDQRGGGVHHRVGHSKHFGGDDNDFPPAG